MRLWELECLGEATNLYCYNCGDDLGKDTENRKNAYCGQCGETTRNPRGYTHESRRPLKVRTKKV